MKIGVAIPTYKNHLQYLDRVLNSIELQTRIPDIVIVSASECEDKNIHIGAYSFPIKILTNINKQNASTNRNIAANALLKESVDIISFIDGDDEMYPERIDYLLKAFNGDADIVLHDYIIIHNKNDDTNRYSHYVDHMNLYPNSIIGNPRHCGVKVDIPNLTHGHLSIRASLFAKEKFKEEPNYVNWEDAEYCRRIIDKGHKNCYIKNPITLYHKYQHDTLDYRRIFIFILDSSETVLSTKQLYTINNIRKNTEIPVSIITYNNLFNWINPKYPIHETFTYLNMRDKIFYLTVYFIHHYGGGFYKDTSTSTTSWRSQFHQLETKNNVYGSGYTELLGGVAKIDNEILYNELNKNYKSLIGTGAFIFKPDTLFTIDMYRIMHYFMDQHYTELKEGGQLNLIGNVFHPIMYKYKDNILHELPISMNKA